MKKIIFIAVLMVLGLAVFYGCGKGSKPKERATVNPAVDLMFPRYEASLADGIDFKRPGYPIFLAEVTGISGLESWGRWTDGPTARFRFKQPLPSKFKLIINVGAISTNVGKQTIIRAGKMEKEFTVKDAAATEYVFNFEGVDSTDILEIIPSKPSRPNDLDSKNPDKRLLGVAMVYLKIQ